MAFSFLYLAFRALLGALVRSRRGLDVKDVELLVLRHELEVLRRQVARPKLRAADRALFAAAACLKGANSRVAVRQRSVVPVAEAAELVAPADLARGWCRRWRRRLELQCAVRPVSRRDPDSNRGHHDFQAPGIGARNVLVCRAICRIDGSQMRVDSHGFAWV